MSRTVVSELVSTPDRTHLNKAGSNAVGLYSGTPVYEVAKYSTNFRSCGGGIRTAAAYPRVWEKRVKFRRVQWVHTL